MNSIPVDRRLPGADLVVRGIEDLAEGLITEEALLVAAASPRLRSLGLDVAPVPVEKPLHRLYELLAAADSADVHARTTPWSAAS